MHPAQQATIPNTCSGSGCDLSASTIYHLVVSADGGSNTSGNHAYTWPLTISFNETQTPNNNGWSIANATSVQTDQSNTWQNHTYQGDNIVGVFSVQAKKIITLTATNITHNAATLIIADHSGTWYYKYSAPDGGSCSSAVSSGTTTASLSSLAGNTSYTYKAYSDSGCATELTSTSTDVALLTQPAKPTTPTVTAGVGSGKLFLTSLLRGGGGALTRWEYTTDDGSTWIPITSDTDNLLVYTVTTGLSNGTSYTFKVRAVNATGAGPASDASSSVAPVEPTLTASGVTHNSATLTIRNYIPDWYYKYTSPQGGTTCPPAFGSDSGTATAALTGLAGNTSYTYKAYSDSGCTGEVAAAAPFLTTPAQPSKPSVSIGSGKLTISSSVSGGSGALSKWQYTTDNGTNWKDISTTSTTLSHTVTGLTDGTNYTFKVRAVNSAGSGVSGGGTGPESAASTATAPQTATLAANNVMATTATLAITDYSGNWYYKRTAPNPSAGTCVAVTGIGTPDARLSDLSPGTSYTFKAYSDNTCDTELTSDATDAEFLTRPGQVSGVTVIASNRSLKVSWTAPSGTVTGYTVQWKSGSGEYDTTNQATSTGTSYTISGLTNDTQYTLRVAAKNTTGDGAWSADATGTPNTNVTLTAGDVTDTSLKLTITNHSGTWYYKYTSPGGDTSCTAVSSATAIVTGLAANTSYTYAAYSDRDCSTELATATAVKTLLAQVTGVEVVPRDDSLSVTWDRPRPGSGSPNYEAQWKSGNEDWDRTNRQNTAQNYFTQIPSLSNAVEYTVRVRRITTSPSAVGEWSEPVKGTPAEVALTTRSIGATTATLVIANYANSNGDVWYYKRTAPTAGDQPYGTCSDGLTTGNTTVVLTGLSSGTRYTFKAYSDSGCTDAKVLAEVSFTSSTPSNPTPPPASPEISASAVTATTATLTIANYSGSWYYKRTAPTAGDHPYGSCSAVVTGTSVALTGLSASTSYSFTAYSDGGCTAELATATLSTPAPAVTLTPSDTTATSLKLTIANHSGNWYYKHTIPSDGQCSGTVSGSTAVASGLQSSTSYTFKAYSDSGCNTVLAAAAATSTLAPAVTLTATDATATSLKLTITNHSGNWYYKHTIPSDGQCSNAVSGSTAVASGLQSSTSYTFKAYSDSDCNTELATAAATSTLAPGAPAVTLTAGDATATSLKLTIANHSGSWYYKYTTPSGGQCSGVVSGTTAVASGLQSSTSYIFKAYSDSDCNTVLATAAATSTLAPGAPAVTLTAGDATATSLKLTIANHSGSWYYQYNTIPGGGQCSSVVSGTTAVASGLQSSTSYIFKAYSDSGCTTVLATAAATSTNKDPATQAAQKRISQVAQEVTPAVNRAVSANTANAVTQRVSQVVQGTLPWPAPRSVGVACPELPRVLWSWPGVGQWMARPSPWRHYWTTAASLPPSPHRARPLQQRRETAVPPPSPGGCGAPWTTDRLPPAQSRAPPSGTLRCSPPWWVLTAW